MKKHESNTVWSMPEFKMLIEYIVDAGRPVTSDEIRDRFNIKESMTGNFNTRTIIKEAIRIYAVDAGIPIGANAKGYFVMKTEAEIYKYRDNLQHRINGMEERIMLAVNAWNNKCKKG